MDQKSQIPSEPDLINYFHLGSKSPKDYRIGTENEKFATLALLITLASNRSFGE